MTLKEKIEKLKFNNPDNLPESYYDEAINHVLALIDEHKPSAERLEKIFRLKMVSIGIINKELFEAIASELVVPPITGEQLYKLHYTYFPGMIKKKNWSELIVETKEAYTAMAEALNKGRVK